MRPALISLALLTGCFALAVTIEPKWSENPLYERHERPPVEVVMGDARRIFAGHFFTKADAYFHSGYYPGIFDQAATNRQNHLVTGTGLEQPGHSADFLGEPLDRIDRFSRSFFPSSHTHLDEEDQGHEHGPDCQHDHAHEAGEDAGAPRGQAAPSGKVREMLPWVKITASLDPSRIESYTVGAYWLRTRMGKAKEAEAFLREGLKKNPGSAAILFELGRIFRENYHEIERPRNVWQAALERWIEERNLAREPDPFLVLQITWQLALLEQETGNVEEAIRFLTIAKNASPNPDVVERRIQEIAAARTPAGSL